MKDQLEKPEGRGCVILILVIMAFAVGFTLGYFIGYMTNL
jgi:hypothetical protein